MEQRPPWDGRRPELPSMADIGGRLTGLSGASRLPVRPRPSTRCLERVSDEEMPSCPPCPLWWRVSERPYPSSAGRFVLDQLDGVAGIVADERKPLSRRVAHVERHLDAFGFQLREDRRQVLHLEAKVLHAVRPEVL